MRKIETEEEREKRKKRNQLIVGGILILIMVVSTAGFAFFSNPDANATGSQNTEKITYNGIEFKRNQNNGLWEFNIQGQIYSTVYNPEDTANINTDFSAVINDFYNKPLYYVLSNTEAAGEIERNIARYAERSQEICLQEISWQNCSADLVIKNCTNNIFVFHEINELNKTNIYKRENCIFIETEYGEQTKAGDKVIFKILGIE